MVKNSIVNKHTLLFTEAKKYQCSKEVRSEGKKNENVFVIHEIV